MKPYVVKQGDYLEKIAHALGVDPDEVWNDPKNAELKKQRDPNQLHPGDILYVPAAPRRWLPLRPGTTNRFVAEVPKTHVRLAFKKLNKPRAGERYVVAGLGAPVEGTTDGEGGVEVDVPVHIREIQVTFPADYVTYSVRVGDMDPIDEPSGVRKRLEHLGYYTYASGASEEEIEAQDRSALLAFQRDRGLEPTGLLDDATKAKLRDEHGS